MTDPAATTATLSKKPRQGRSPAFPFIPLKKALERVDAFRKAEGGRPKHFAPIKSACAAWGLGLKTGPAIQTVAALGHYGLLEFEGSGDTRSARPTDLALRILLDSQPVSTERDGLIKKAALTPAIHKELWEKWAADLPSDPTLETYLVRDRGFSDNGARDLMAEYKATIAFANLTAPATLTPNDHADETTTEPLVEVGDFVNAEVDGRLVFDKPKRVRAIQDRWVFVEDSESGVLMEQVELVEKGTGAPAPAGLQEPPRLPLPSKNDALPPDWHEERLLDDRGEEIFIRYKGEPSSARYRFIRDYLDFKLRRRSPVEMLDELIAELKQLVDDGDNGNLHAAEWIILNALQDQATGQHKTGLLHMIQRRIKSMDAKSHDGEQLIKMLVEFIDDQFKLLRDSKQ